MKKKLLLMTACTLAMSMFLAGCGGGRKADGEVSKTAEPSKEVSKVDENKSGSAAGENKGFPADATIGVSGDSSGCG